MGFCMEFGMELWLSFRGGLGCCAAQLLCWLVL